ncbi:hypothetical protein BD413DRAFT_466061 [Trametes elegans]|nr:hypothetical protein BD413DRAFT_466061 [Trametes elegans]
MSTYTSSRLECSASYQPQDALVQGIATSSILTHPYPLLASRPHVHVSTGYEINLQATGEYLVRDFLTPSPTSSSSSDHAHEGSPSFPLHFASTSSSRRESRRRPSGASPPSTDEGLVVRGSIAHPYARLYNKKHGAGKRRKMWNHALEKMLFTPQEISTMGAPHRRTIYTASLEAHVDRLHEQLLGLALFPVPFEKLEPYRGLNSKTAKSMVSGLHHDASELKLKILELERAVSILS